MWELKLRLFTNTDKDKRNPASRSPGTDTPMDAQDLEQVRSQEGSGVQASSSGSSSALDSSNSQSQSTSVLGGTVQQKTAKEKYGKVSRSG